MQVVRRIIRRPLTAACWQEMWFLLVSAVMGMIGYTFVIAAFSTAAGLSIVLIGLPALIAVMFINRWWCGIERRRAQRVLGYPVPARYSSPRGQGLIARGRSVLRDRQSWLDAGWALLSGPTGMASILATGICWATVGGLLSSPIWLWSIPNWIHRNDVLLSIVFPLLAPPLAVLTAWMAHGLVLAQCELASKMLGIGRTAALAQRVQTLSETRAGAVDAAVSELQRVERDLHDGAQARLVALAMDLGMAEQQLRRADPETAAEHVAAARGQARAAMAELRDLVRGIGPSILTDRGLDAALTALVAGREPPVTLHVDWPSGHAGAAETAAYFVVAESLTNARKHARAQHISVHVWGAPKGERLIAEIHDDGVGGADPQSGSGLAGMAKRVAALDGELTVTSPPGGPTTIHAELPCAS